MDKITTCSKCNGKNVVKLTNEKNVYGLSKLEAPSTVDLNHFLPVDVFCCKECGHIELIHRDPSVIQIDYSN